MTAPAIRSARYGYTRIGFTPPGYYVDSTEYGRQGPCAHCEAPLIDHQGPERFCPVPPAELRS